MAGKYTSEPRRLRLTRSCSLVRSLTRYYARHIKQDDLYWLVLDQGLAMDKEYTYLPR